MSVFHQGQQNKTFSNRPKLNQCIIIVLGKTSAGKTSFIGAASNGGHAQSPYQKPFVTESNVNIDGTQITFLEVAAFQRTAISNAEIFGSLSSILWNRYATGKGYHEVAAALYIHNSDHSPDEVDLVHLDFMNGMAGQQNSNRLGLVFNERNIERRSQGQHDSLSWPEPLYSIFDRKELSVPDPIVLYRSPEIPPRIIRNVLELREAVTFALVDELYQSGCKRHKTSVGIQIGNELEMEYTRIDGQIREVKLRKENLRRVTNNKVERTRQEEELKRQIKGLESDLKDLGKFKKWWAKN